MTEMSQRMPLDRVAEHGLRFEATFLDDPSRRPGGCGLGEYGYPRGPDKARASATLQKYTLIQAITSSHRGIIAAVTKSSRFSGCARRPTRVKKSLTIQGENRKSHRLADSDSNGMQHDRSRTMPEAQIGHFVTATVAIDDDPLYPVQVRQGILTGFSSSGKPLLLGESNTVFQGLTSKLTVVPDRNLDRDTLRFVQEWRAQNLCGHSNRVSARRDTDEQKQR